MSEFMNKKEQTISLVLTRKGKQEVSAGKFKPVYYSFHDSGILYDGQYAGITEYQKDIVSRIKDTPQTEPSGLYKQTALSESFSMIGNILGTCDPTTQYTPAFHLSIESAKISGTVMNQVGSFNGVVPRATVVTYISNKQLETQIPELFLTLNEEHGLDSKDNFEVELFEIDSVGNLNKIPEPSEFFQMIPDERVSTQKQAIPIIYTDVLTVNQKECIE